MTIATKEQVIAAGYNVEDFVHGVDRSFGILCILRSERSAVLGGQFFIVYEGGFYHYTGWQSSLEKMTRYALSDWAIFDNKVYVRHSHELNNEIKWLSLHENEPDTSPDSDAEFAKLLIEMATTQAIEKYLLVGVE